MSSSAGRASGTPIVIIADLLHEDLAIRNFIAKSLRDAGVSRVEIDRNANMVLVTIHTARPGIVIGRGGQKVDELRQRSRHLPESRVRVNIVEIRQPELDATLVARSVAEQLERRVSHRRAMKQAVTRTMQRGAEGIKIIVGGRLGGAEMSRRETEKSGRVPLHTLRANIDYGTAEAAHHVRAHRRQGLDIQGRDPARAQGRTGAACRSAGAAAEAAVAEALRKPP